MKNLILVLLLCITCNAMAQEDQNEESLLVSLRNETDKSILDEKIKNLKENGSVDELMALVQYYRDDAEKSVEIARLFHERYPASQESQMARLVSFQSVKENPQEIEAHYKTIEKQYSNVNMDFEKNFVALAFAEVPDTAKVMEYIDAMEDPIYRVGAILTNLDLIIPIDESQALEMATNNLKRAKKLKGQTALSDPLKADPQFVYNEYVKMYGKLLYNSGRLKEAFKYIKEAYKNLEKTSEGNPGGDREIIEIHAFLSAKLKGDYKVALPVLAEMVEQGKIQKKYIEQVRAGYKKLYPERDAEAYIASLKEKFIEEIKVKVEKLKVNKPTPEFYISDIHGKKVTLADFKGKTIVLDFWATWCIPCVASFPAMQMAVDRYKDDPNVKFLFIHTWDNVEEPLNNAISFLDKRDYNFDLYMDFANPETRRSPAADAFGINGIPAKFVIDGNGRIRFQVEGFEGLDEAIAEEVVQMVEMARSKP